MTTVQRFVLDRSTLAGAVSMAGLEPTGLSALPEPGKPNMKKLEGAGAIVDGALHPDLVAALSVIDAPGWVLTVSANGAGRPAWTETRFVAAGSSVIGWAERDGEADIAVLGSRSAAVLLLDELLKLTDLPVGEPGDPVTLSSSAYATLLAVADLVQEAAFTNRIERATTQPPPRLDPEELARMVTTGLRSVDTRWAVTAGALTAPVALGMDTAALRDGLGELRTAGLLTGSAKEPHLSAAGVGLVDSLNRIITIGSLELATPAAGSAVGRVTILRCMASLWSGLWGVAEDGTTEVTLVELDHRGGLGVVEDLLGALIDQPPEPVAAAAASPEPESVIDDGQNAFCGKCGAEYKDDTAFCTNCGAARD
jgi:hypothetical protein